MIRWCAYCQKYIGEVEPFDRFEISHGICRRCVASGLFTEKDPVQQIRPVVEYYAKVSAAVRCDQGPLELLEEGLQLGLDPWDLLIGIIQPALRRMGERWACAQATVNDEHQLTTTCTEILALMERRQAGFGPLRQGRPPEVLLVNAEGNFHTLGIRLVEFFLLTRSIPVMAIYSGLPTQDVIRIVKSIRPLVVGISCAMPGQMTSARRTAEAIADLPFADNLDVFVGGFAARGIKEISSDMPFRVCISPSDLLDHLPAPAV